MSLGTQWLRSDHLPLTCGVSGYSFIAGLSITLIEFVRSLRHLIRGFFSLDQPRSRLFQGSILSQPKCYKILTRCFSWTAVLGRINNDSSQQTQKHTYSYIYPDIFIYLGYYMITHDDRAVTSNATINRIVSMVPSPNILVAGLRCWIFCTCLCFKIQSARELGR